MHEAHMNTLAKLQELAIKHNCTIKMGFKNRVGEGIPDNIFKKYTGLEIEPLRDEVVIDNELYIESTLFFELFDKKKEVYHVLEYREICIDFDFKIDMYTDEEIKDVIYSLNGTYDEDEGHYHNKFDEQEIFGFGSIQETVDSINVYREGIALREFSKLVCDYFGEPRIKELY